MATRKYDSMRPRVEEALRQLAVLVPRAQVRRNLQEKFSISERVARLAVEQAVKELGASFREEMPSLRDQLNRALQALYLASMKRGDMKACVSILDRWSRLGGVDVGSPSPVSPASVSIVETDPDRVRARIAELMKNVGRAA